MTALRISLGFLLALTLACALEKDNLPAANDAHPVNVDHAQEIGIDDAIKVTWPFDVFIRRPRVTGPNVGDEKDVLRSQKIHRRSRRSSSGLNTAFTLYLVLGIVFGVIVPISISASIGIGFSCFFKNRQNNQPAHAGRVIQPAQPSAYRAQPMSQP
ncbi:hypothetical protein AAVH_34857, partial [Aphelenchoides avenae]